VRSGGFYLNAGMVGGPHFGAIGNYGHDWSSRASSTTASGVTAPSAYYLGFNIVVNASNGPYERYIAFPLRCLSTVLGMGGRKRINKNPCQN